MTDKEKDYFLNNDFYPKFDIKVERVGVVFNVEVSTTLRTYFYGIGKAYVEKFKENFVVIEEEYLERVKRGLIQNLVKKVEDYRMFNSTMMKTECKYCKVSEEQRVTLIKEEKKNGK